MANSIIIRETGVPQQIQVRVTELSKGPQGIQGPPGKDGAIQYTAGTGINISASNVISATGSSTVAWGSITGSLASQTDLDSALGAKAAASALGNLASLTTTTKTDAVSAINEVNATAGSAKSTADGLAAYITLTDYGTITPTVSSAGTLVSDKTNMNYALNADGSFGKIYGRLRYTSSSNSAVTVTLPISSLVAPASAFTIVGAVFYMVNISGTFQVINSADLTINTNHTATISMSAQPSAAIVTLWLPPCLYYFTDFGDTPTPE